MMTKLHQKIFFTVISLGLSCIAIELIPLARQATYWNKCLDTTRETLKKISSNQSMEKNGKDVIAVMICNGAVFEPRITATIRQSN